MQVFAAVVAAVLLVLCSGGTIAAGVPLDAPEERVIVNPDLEVPASYELALGRWRNADVVNAWIGLRFEYDMQRAMQLSETQRQAGGSAEIHAPRDFFASPRGVCVDLARFAVETLQAIDASSRPRYIMIEFDPVTIGGNTLRRHWLVSFEREGKLWFFADSKRPGHVAGPYTSTDEFIADYARYRARHIVSYRELDSYKRRQRTLAVKQSAQ